MRVVASRARRFVGKELRTEAAQRREQRLGAPLVHERLDAAGSMRAASASSARRRAHVPRILDPGPAGEQDEDATLSGCLTAQAERQPRAIE